MDDTGIIRVRTPEQTTQIINQERERRIAEGKATYEQTPITDALAHRVRSDWAVAKSVKSHINHRLVDCLERRNGEYSAEKLAQIKATQGSAIFMQITGAKCRAAKAYISDLYTKSGDRPFAIAPTPVADLPPDIAQRMMQEAFVAINQAGLHPQIAQELLKKHEKRIKDELREVAEDRAEKMERQIEDMLIDAHFRTEFDAFLDDLVTYPAALMKGPLFTNRRKIKWVDLGQGQGFAPKAAIELVSEVRRVSPFNSFPSPGIKQDFNGHWHIELRQFTYAELAAARGAPGYNTEAITQVLYQYRAGGLSEWLWSEDEHRRLSGLNSVFGKRETIDALEWTGTLSGQMLVDGGMDPRAVPDLVQEYPVSVMVIGTYTVRALVNPDPAGKSDYYKTCWEPVPGTFWGRALPEIMADQQDMCNGAARALANNLGIASGPQMWMDTSRMVDGADYENVHPWKIWYFKNPVGGVSQGQVRDPIGFFQPESNASELMQVFERFSKYADEVTGMPAFAYGSDDGAGAAKTASGLSMLLNASSKVIKSVVHSVDIHVIEPLVEKFYNHVMMYHPDQSIKGDATARARGSDALIHSEAAQARAQELLVQLGNPIDQQIIGIEGRRELIEQVLNTGDMPVERIVPTLEELHAKMEAQLEQQPPPGKGAGEGQPGSDAA